MTSRFDPSENPSTPDAGRETIDVNKRYDVYSNVPGASVVVFRNVAIKGLRGIAAKQYDRIAGYLELETPDQKSFFVWRMSVIGFCEHGTPFPGEAFSFK